MSRTKFLFSSQISTMINANKLLKASLKLINGSLKGMCRKNMCQTIETLIKNKYFKITSNMRIIKWEVKKGRSKLYLTSIQMRALLADDTED